LVENTLSLTTIGPFFVEFFKVITHFKQSTVLTD